MGDSLWLFWVAVALVAGVVEVFSLAVIFAMVAGGALAAALAAALTGSVTVSVITFAVATVLLLLGARPPVKAYLQRRLPNSPMHTDALIGRSAEVLSAVDAGTGGRVRIGGEVWSARSTGAAIPSGSTVYVTTIDGATAVVQAEPVPPPA